MWPLSADTLGGTHGLYQRSSSFAVFLFVSLDLVWPSFYSERPRGLRQPGSFYCEEEELRDRLTHAEGGREGRKEGGTASVTVWPLAAL